LPGLSLVVYHDRDTMAEYGMQNPPPPPPDDGFLDLA